MSVGTSKMFCNASVPLASLAWLGAPFPFRAPFSLHFLFFYFFKLVRYRFPFVSLFFILYFSFVGALSVFSSCRVFINYFFVYIFFLVGAFS